MSPWVLLIVFPLFVLLGAAGTAVAFRVLWGRKAARIEKALAAIRHEEAKVPELHSGADWSEAFYDEVL